MLIDTDAGSKSPSYGRWLGCRHDLLRTRHARGQEVRVKYVLIIAHLLDTEHKVPASLGAVSDAGECNANSLNVCALFEHI